MSGIGFASPQNSLDVYQGASLNIDLEVVDALGVAVSLVDAVVYFSLKPCLSSSDTVIRKISTEASQIEIYDAPGGKARIYIKHGDTFRLSVGEYVFDVWVVYATEGTYHSVIGPTPFLVHRPVTTF